MLFLNMVCLTVAIVHISGNLRYTEESKKWIVGDVVTQEHSHHEYGSSYSGQIADLLIPVHAFV
jgi:hypothetical protein